MSDRPRTRLYLDLPFVPGGEVAVDGDRAHYLGRVLRLGPGDRVLVFNGQDGEWLAEVAGLSKSAGRLTLLDQQRPQPAAAGPWLLFAPLKGGRTEYVVEKAVELGVGVIQPVYTRRSDVTRVNLDRMRANAMEAAEQCERLSVPEVREGQPLDRLLAGWDSGRTLFVAAESGHAQPLVTAITAHPGQAAAWLIGPEGGFAPPELDALTRMSFVVPVGLGPRILRADTAAFAALAVWQAVAGDWIGQAGDNRPPFRT
ncbi:MAG: hypothetical protein RLY86_3693 [Pseudomonadota bacterium]|jgi:16S rRNA (uracil1498-N3)-methyltransferase